MGRGISFDLQGGFENTGAKKPLHGLLEPFPEAGLDFETQQPLGLGDLGKRPAHIPGPFGFEDGFNPPDLQDLFEMIKNIKDGILFVAGDIEDFAGNALRL